jgi:prephenate dehydrogenase
MRVTILFMGTHFKTYLHKVFILKELKQITVIGMGLLGGSITLGVSRTLPGVKAMGYSHRESTRQKSRESAVASEISDDIKASVRQADIVILATPIYTFEEVFDEIRDALPDGCIVTDVGSTKLLPHRWAEKRLPKKVCYVGSHPIAGSEQRGVEFARDDLFDQTKCIITTTSKTNRQAVNVLKKFWAGLGCIVKEMSPAEHDRVYANISHVPHAMAVSLVNASNAEELEFAGKGFSDTTRIASSPANIWADILLSNAKNTIKGIDKVIAELRKLKKVIKAGDKKQIETLLEKARDKRNAMITNKINKKELLP